MAQLNINMFSSYHLSDSESLQGSVYTFLQKCVLQNQLAVLAHEKIGLEYNPNDSMKFLQEESYKRGQLDMIQYLLENSEASEKLLTEPNGEVIDPLI